MVNNKKSLRLGLILSMLLVLSLVIYSVDRFKNKDLSPVTESVATATTPVTATVIYNNSDFGFNFSLPDSWRGYSIVQNTWEGNPLAPTGTSQSGPKLLIRNPNWTSTLAYEDIPVMVFTLEQWNSYVAEGFYVSAAPVRATELGRNNLYVFALPPRWNFDYSEGYAEAENIIKSNPLKAFSIENN